MSDFDSKLMAGLAAFVAASATHYAMRGEWGSLAAALFVALVAGVIAEARNVR
jgi:hypothetical protein